MKRFHIIKIIKYYRRQFKRKKMRLKRGGKCLFCDIVGRLRCQSCLSWYCSSECHTRHYHAHKRDCNPRHQTMGLIWQDGSDFLTVCKTKNHSLGNITSLDEVDQNNEVMVSSEVEPALEVKLEELKIGFCGERERYLDEEAAVDRKSNWQESKEMDASNEGHEDDNVEDMGWKNGCDCIARWGDAGGCCVELLTQALCIKLINMLMEGPIKTSGISITRTYIQGLVLGAICRQTTSRFRGYVERLMPLLMQYARQEDDEMKEHVIQVCEAMVSKCGSVISRHIPAFVDLCLEYITYDPNYNYDEGDDRDMKSDYVDDSSGLDGYSEDEHVSWKIRMAAVKFIEAVFINRHEMIKLFYRTISPSLITRFKEREENVKANICHTYQALFSQTKSSPHVKINQQDPGCMNGEEFPVALLQAQLPNFVKALQRLMKGKSIKNMQGCFSLLTELLLVLPGALATNMVQLIPGIQFSLCSNQDSSNMKIATLSFIQCFLTSHHPAVFHPHAAPLGLAILSAVNDSYNINTEELAVLKLLVKVLRPVYGLPTTFDLTPCIEKFYQCCFVRRKAQDIDKEVKERAISCMKQIVAHFGHSLQRVLGSCFPIILAGFKNSIIRMTAVKELISIASSPLCIDLHSNLSDSMPVPSSFLRMSQWALKLSTLQLLDTILKNYSTGLALDTLSPLLTELPPLLSETDLHIVQLTLHLLTSISASHRQTTSTIEKTVLPEVPKLAGSSLLQGAALKAVLDFFKSVVSAGVPSLADSDPMVLLVNPVLGETGGSIHKQRRTNIAKCVASLASHSKGEIMGVVKQIMGNLTSSYQDYEVDEMKPNQVSPVLQFKGEITKSPISRGGWKKVSGGLYGGHPLPIVTTSDTNQSSDAKVEAQQAISISDIIMNEAVGASFDSDNDVSDASNDSCQFQVAEECELAKNIMEAISKESEINLDKQNVYDFTEDDEDVVPSNVHKSNIASVTKCCSNMCCQQDLSKQVLTIMDEIMKKSGKEKKQFLLDHLIKQEEFDISTVGFQLFGKFFCRKSFSLVSGVSEYIVKEASKAFESGQVTFVHGNELGMRETEAGLGFIIWMKRHAALYGNQAPDEDTLILSSCYSLTDLFLQYKLEACGPQIQKSTFYRSFKRQFGPYRVNKSLPHIRISSYSKHSKCDRCILLDKYQRSCKRPEDFELARGLKQSHKQTYKMAYQAIQEKRCNALYDADNHIFIQGRFCIVFSKMRIRYLEKLNSL